MTDRWIDRQDWKHYLPATSMAGSKNTLKEILDGTDLIILSWQMNAFSCILYTNNFSRYLYEIYCPISHLLKYYLVAVCNAISNGKSLMVLNHEDLQAWSCSCNEVTLKLLPQRPIGQIGTKKTLTRELNGLTMWQNGLILVSIQTLGWGK